MKKRKKAKPKSRKRARVGDLASRKSPRGGATAAGFGKLNPARTGNTIGSGLGADKILNP